VFQPPIFRENRPEVMWELMVTHPLATIVSAETGALSADHVPLVLYRNKGDYGLLHGHIAQSNPLFRKTKEPLEILTIFQGPQSYITPSWYASKQEHGKVVPTWNYVVVHAHGTLRFKQETPWLLQHLNDLTAQHEGRQPTPWKVSDAPGDFIERQLRDLVGFEIEILDLKGTWKVSQNKDPADWAGVRDGLEKSGNSEAVAMSVFVHKHAPKRSA